MKLSEIVREIKSRPEGHINLEKGKYYDAFVNGEWMTEIGYIGVNVHGDHMFFNGNANNKNRISYLYIGPKELWKYKLKLSTLQEIGKDLSTPITKVIDQDPESGSTTWSVNYKPDINGLLNNLDKLIRKYRDIIKVNKLRDPLVNQNYELLKAVKRGLVLIVRNKYPELLPKVDKSGMYEIKSRPVYTFKKIPFAVFKKAVEQELGLFGDDDIVEDWSKVSNIEQLINMLDSMGYNNQEIFNICISSLVQE